MSLICPICGLALTLNTHGVGCANRHQYDRAKEGYLNLLPVQFKHSREPGDAKEQLAARRLFLSAGFFQPLREKLNTLTGQNLQSVLDIGCGEGYFTASLAGQNKDAQIYGIDIAKAAVKMAAKNAAANMTYAVASSYQLPIADKSIDLIQRIYAPSKDEELVRVLKPTGRLMVVTPGEKHLLALRKNIYESVKPHVPPKLIAGFNHPECHQLTYDIDIPSGNLTHALIQMTPFSWRINNQVAERLVTEGMTDCVDFQISIYTLQSAPQ